MGGSASSAFFAGTASPNSPRVLLNAHIDPGSGEINAQFDGTLQTASGLLGSNWTITFAGHAWTAITVDAAGSGVTIVATQAGATADPDRLSYTAASPDLRDAAGLLVGPQTPVVLYEL